MSDNIGDPIDKGPLGEAEKFLRNISLPTDSAARKAIPLVRGLLDYFPAALAEVAKLSVAGNEKHNPGQPLHWSREKSADHADCVVRHVMERGTVDPEDGILHDVKQAWRSLAQLQVELETRGAAVARGAKQPDHPLTVAYEQAKAAHEQRDVDKELRRVRHYIAREAQQRLRPSAFAILTDIMKEAENV